MGIWLSQSLKSHHALPAGQVPRETDPVRQGHNYPESRVRRSSWLSDAAQVARGQLSRRVVLRAARGVESVGEAGCLACGYLALPDHQVQQLVDADWLDVVVLCRDPGVLVVGQHQRS